MPVAVVGMHRSGTSMVAHALQLAGLYLGAENELYNTKTPDNPDGYWEHVRFVGMNDEILSELGGGWDTPPEIPVRWRNDTRLRELRVRAKKLVKDFDGHEPWGFKDPRASLTVSLWAELIPELHVILCVRNPLEVALSLHRRHVSYSTALRLWGTYNRRVLESAPPGRLILTDYETWLAQPATEIRRVLKFLDMPAARPVVEQARSAVQGDLRRIRFTGPDLLDLGVAPELIELYTWLRRQAAMRTPARGERILPRVSAPSEDAAVVDVRRLDTEVLRKRAERLELQLADRSAALERTLVSEREERLRREEIAARNAALERSLADVNKALETLVTLQEGQSTLLAQLGELEERVLLSVEGVQSSFYDMQAVAPEGSSSEKAEYQALVRRIKGVAREWIPRGSTVLVVSKGDEDLTSLFGRPAWHFPQADDGRWAGYHPKSSLPAIAQLEALRAKGADHLLLPATSMWWLDEYADFRRHLEAHYVPVFSKDGVCAIFALREPTEAAPAWRQELREVVAGFRTRFGRDPAVLDWETGLDLGAAFPGASVFSPPAEGNGLPYLDGSVDLVALNGVDPANLAEADRVAAAAVIVFPGEQNGAEPEVRWKAAVGPQTLQSVSIVIPCHDGIAYTTACLETLLATLPRDFEGQILVVDDASTDGTGEWLEDFAERNSIVTVLRNSRNLGFLESCNRAAEVATGELLLFLNNDTILLPGWLPPLLRVFVEREEVGAAGGRLLYPDGRLQEAGGLVFRDGSAWKFGYRDQDPEAPVFSYLREVDYCSGCLLATPRSLFLELGGFDRRFAPGFYEDTDYCFALRERRLRVYYQPECSIVHVEGGTAGTDLDRGPKRHQALNQKKFARKWRQALERQPERPEQLDAASLTSIADLAWR